MMLSFKKANAPLFIDSSSLDTRNDSIFLIQIKILFEHFSDQSNNNLYHKQNETDMQKMINKQQIFDTEMHNPIVMQTENPKPTSNSYMIPSNVMKNTEGKYSSSVQNIASIVFNVAKNFDKNMKKTNNIDWIEPKW